MRCRDGDGWPCRRRGRFPGRHVVANVDVAELRDAQAVEFGRKISDGNVYALDGVTQAAGSKSVGRSEKWGATSEDSRVLEEGAARGIEVSGYGSGTKAGG